MKKEVVNRLIIPPIVNATEYIPLNDKPNKFVRTYGHFKKQINALYIHSSQYPKGDKATNAVVLYLKVRAVEYGFKTFSIPSEGFRMMNRTRMHCLPEASK